MIKNRYRLITCTNVYFFGILLMIDIIAIINMVTEDWLKPRNVKERKRMVTWAQKSRTIIISSYILIAMPCIYCILLSIFGISMTQEMNINNTKKIFPLRLYYFYDVSKRPQYELIYISLSVAIFFTAITYTGIDHFLGLDISHLWPIGYSEHTFYVSE